MSFRKSYYEERDYDFQLALPKSRKIQDKIFLIEWESQHILKYVEEYKKLNKLGLTEASLIQIDKFIQIIKDNKYEVYYGDIPKRPLFLEMILRDIESGDIQKRTISELYLNYFLEKFEREALINTPEYAAEVILKGIEKGKSRILIGRDAKILDILVRTFPDNYFKRIPKSMTERAKVN